MGKLIWLASFPKSGNTWLRVFLLNLLRNPATPTDINNLTKLTAVDGLADWYRHVDPRPPTELNLEEVAKLRPRVHQFMTTIFPDNVFVKTHSALMSDFGVPLITLEVTAGAIYVIRNPLDVAVSYSHHLAKSIDATIALMGRKGARTENIEGWVSEVIGSWSENVETWTARPHPTLHVVRYEDMKAETLKTFGGIARFLGLEPPRDRLERALRLSSFKVLQEQERRHGFVEKSKVAERFFRAGEVGQWRTALSVDQVERIVADHGAQMARYGYLPTDRGGTP
ncbi:MAG: sulfotransferase domain-containing protein [Alphaproteobacteria bacterium]